jgi:hypothetical protein
MELPAHFGRSHRATSFIIATANPFDSKVVTEGRSLNQSSVRLTIVAGALLIAGAAEARTFISPMGEPFRDMIDGKTPDEIWFRGADKDGDGRITRAEFLADAGRFFKMLDVNHDNEIGPEEIDRYEDEVAPEVRTDGFEGDLPSGGGYGGRGGGGHRHGGGGGGHRGGDGGGESGGEGSSGEDHPGPTEPTGQGAGRFGYLDLPEPVIAADSDFNRGVSAKEFADAAYQRFNLLDANHDGVLTRDELPRFGRPGGSDKGPPRGGRHRPSPDRGAPDPQ